MIRTNDRNASSHSKTYHTFAPYYDKFISPIYSRRIHEVISRLNIPAGAHVLELGIGTGVSLPAYPPGISIDGIDLSSSMLQQAQERVEALGLENVRLHEMNACDLRFPDCSFDFVMAFHVVSVVSDLGQLMREVHRVCRPGGSIIVINHFRSPRKFIASMVDALNPITQKLGWRTTIRFEDLQQHAPIEVRNRYKTRPASLFTVIEAVKQ